METIASVVPDVKHLGLKEDEGPVVYLPYAQKQQDWLTWTTIVARTASDPLTLVPAARGAIREVNKPQAVGEVGTLEQILARSTSIQRFATLLIGVLAGIAISNCGCGNVRIVGIIRSLSAFRS